MANADNKVHYALTNVYIATLEMDLETSTVTFGNPKRLLGAVSMDLSAQGDVIKLRADGMDYYVVNSNNGYQGDLNIARIPDWFRSDILGDTISATDKVLVETTTQEPKAFAMLFEFLGDVKGTRHVLYNCAASRPNIKGENKDNLKDPDTDTLSLTASPLQDGKVKASTTAETPEDVYKNWFQQVWEKDSGTA
jgi:phi13 family phage major tail protein